MAARMGEMERAKERHSTFDLEQYIITFAAAIFHAKWRVSRVLFGSECGSYLHETISLRSIREGAACKSIQIIRS